MRVVFYSNSIIIKNLFYKTQLNLISKIASKRKMPRKKACYGLDVKLLDNSDTYDYKRLLIRFSATEYFSD